MAIDCYSGIDKEQLLERSRYPVLAHLQDNAWSRLTWPRRQGDHDLQVRYNGIAVAPNTVLAMHVIPQKKGLCNRPQEGSEDWKVG